MAESKEPFRVSITGIDGAGKDSVALSALTWLSQDGLTIAKTSRPYYRIINGEVEELYPAYRHFADRMHKAADRSQNRTIIGGINACNTLIQSRVIEPILTRSLPRPDVIASARDLSVDPAVYSSYYFPKSSRVAGEVGDVVRRMGTITGITRDMIVWLEVDPEIAMQRIEGRIDYEAEARKLQCGPRAIKRDRWRHLHENAASLAALAARYEGAISKVADLNPSLEVVRIDTTELTSLEVSGIVYRSINHALLQRPHNVINTQELAIA